MTMKYEQNIIAFNGHKYELEYPILDVVQKGDCFIVLFDPDANIKKFGQFPNLICINSYGAKIWTAELPTTDTGDCYYKLKSAVSLRAYSVRSYSCVIDEKTGQILSKKFFK